MEASTYPRSMLGKTIDDRLVGFGHKGVFRSGVLIRKLPATMKQCWSPATSHYGMITSPLYSPDAPPRLMENSVAMEMLTVRC